MQLAFKNDFTSPILEMGRLRPRATVSRPESHRAMGHTPNHSTWTHRLCFFQLPQWDQEDLRAGRESSLPQRRKEGIVCLM